MQTVLSSERILVTGGTGFIGSAVVRALLDLRANIRVLARPTSDRRNLAGLPVEFVTGDLGDAPSLGPALDGCTGLFHVAADYRLWVPDPEVMYRANVDGTRALMQAALDAGVRRIVYTSSVAVLGLHDDGQPADETTKATLEEMIGPYKRSKFLAEAEVRRLVAECHLPAVIVNPSTPVGPRDAKPTPTGRMIVEAASGHMPAFVDTGLNLVHVDDVALGHIAAFERGRVGERYILGGENLTLAEMLGTIAELTGRRKPWLQVPRAAIYPVAFAAEATARIMGGEPFVTVDGLRLAKKKMFFSSAKAMRELGYRPRPVRQALEDAVAWFRAEEYCS
ncbi:MAG TPA: hopanoid-associated sugar epimerase [Methylomirabilota bacterium]|nr:hopanoid-associated sugar epimerase [Methylomirabilota bacterium]